MTEKLKLSLYRFDPAKDKRPYMADYEIPYNPSGNMMVIDAITGEKANSRTKNSIIEAFKKIDDKSDIFTNNIDSRFNTSNILKFY